MAYTISPGAVMLLTFEGRILNQQLMNVSAWLFNTGSTLADGRAALSAVITEVQNVNQPYDLWRTCITSQMTQGQITAQWIYPVRYGYMKQPGSPSTGVVGGEPGGPNMSVCITRRTGLSGRKQQGDIHMFGVPEAFWVNGAVNTTGRTAYDAYGDVMTKPLVIPTPSFTLLPVPYFKPAPNNVSRYIEYQTQLSLRVMRRRTVGVGS